MIELLRKHFAVAAAYPEGAGSVAVCLTPYAPYEYFDYYVDAYYVSTNKVHGRLPGILAELQAIDPRVGLAKDLHLKNAAIRARIAGRGRNTLAINQAYGSRVHITAFTLPVQIEECGANFSECAKCMRCVEACPTGALDEFDFTKCLRHLMGDYKSMTPEYGKKMGTRLFGCDICQRVCPHNAHISEIAPPAGLLSACRALRDSDDPAPLAEYIGANYARPQRMRTLAGFVRQNITGQL